MTLTPGTDRATNLRTVRHRPAADSVRTVQTRDYLDACAQLPNEMPPPYTPRTLQSAGARHTSAGRFLSASLLSRPFRHSETLPVIPAKAGIHDPSRRPLSMPFPQSIPPAREWQGPTGSPSTPSPSKGMGWDEAFTPSPLKRNGWAEASAPSPLKRNGWAEASAPSPFKRNGWRETSAPSPLKGEGWGEGERFKGTSPPAQEPRRHPFVVSTSTSPC